MMKVLPKRAFYESLTWREAAAEDVDFLLSVYHQHAGRTAVSAIDIACGPGDYARLLADKELQVVGLENNPAYLELAQKMTGENSRETLWQLGDLRHFAVDGGVDVAVCLRERITHLLSNEDLIRHFNSVANALSPSGLYIVELPHPRLNPLVDQTPRVDRQERGGVIVERSWPVGDIEIDLFGSIVHAHEELNVEDGGQTFVERTAASRRVFSPQDIALLAIQSESMRLMAVYGDFDINQPLDSSDNSQRMIVVLQKADLPLSYLSPKLEVRPSKDKGDGFGMFAREKIMRDEFLLAYGGHVLTRDQLKALANDPHQFSLQIEEELFLTSKGTLADYVNHSCDPNAGMYGATMLAAMRDILPGEEVCWDYAMSDGLPYDEFECTCGVPGCRLKTSGNDWQIPALWDRYAGYFSPYLQRRIDRLRAEQEVENGEE